MILLPLREKMKWQVHDTYLNGRAGPWLRVHAVSGAEDWPAGDIIHLSYDGLGRAEWTKTVNEPHFIWLRMSSVCPQTGVRPGADWSHPRRCFWGEAVERVLVSLLAALIRPAGGGRRWRDVEWVGTGEGCEKSDWGKKRLWKEGRWGALIGRGEQKGEGHFEKRGIGWERK